MSMTYTEAGLLARHGQTRGRGSEPQTKRIQARHEKILGGVALKSTGNIDGPARDDGGRPTLYVFSGLPGTGKTTLAMLLAKRLAAAYLRIDTVEQALLDLCSFNAEGEGYRLSYRVAADNLRLGVSVVADSCNTMELTRREWQAVAAANGAHCSDIEICCSDQAEHRRRVETRDGGSQGLYLPSWTEVRNREYEPWQSDRTVVDTAGQTIDESFDELIVQLAGDRSQD